MAERSLVADPVTGHGQWLLAFDKKVCEGLMTLLRRTRVHYASTSGFGR